MVQVLNVRHDCLDCFNDQILDILLQISLINCLFLVQIFKYSLGQSLVPIILLLKIYKNYNELTCGYLLLFT